MIAEKLKKSILQAAIQGKLTKREPGDGTASKLLQQIAAEKAKLIKEKKIKKEKPLPEITEEEKPFDLPDGWEWCRLADVCNCINDVDHKMPQVVSKGYPYVSPRDFTVGDKINFAMAKQISEEDFLKLSRKIKPEYGDIIFPRYGTIGVVRMVDTNLDFIVSYSCATLKPNKNNMLSRYIYRCLQSGFVDAEIQKYINKTTQPNVGLQSIKQFLFPLPPLPEQQRIVVCVEELLSQVDSLAKDEKKLDALQSMMPERLKTSLLQAAIQGKLTERLSGDGNAEDLLAEIAVEKQRLIKEKKIKKEKPLPEIAEEEKPFDLPEGWAWCRLGDLILQNVGGGTPNKNVAKYWNGDIPWISVKDIQSSIISKAKDYITNVGLENSSTNLIPKGTLIVCTRMGLGKVAFNIIDVAINQDLRALFLSQNVYKKFIYYFYLANSFEGHGVTVKGISIQDLHNTIVALPPLVEQQRIVQRLEELLPLCEGILSGK